MKISITGAAGTPGSCTTFNIITHERADEIVISVVKGRTFSWRTG